MFDWKSSAEWKRVWRFYQAGIVNMLFGFSLYALLVRLGMNLYAAQGVSTVCGTIFNYFTYSRHTFRQPGSKSRFVQFYILNYFLNLGMLALAYQVIPSPYVAAAIATVLVSAFNYLVLRNMVFQEQQ